MRDFLKTMLISFGLAFTASGSANSSDINLAQIFGVQEVGTFYGIAKPEKTDTEIKKDYERTLCQRSLMLDRVKKLIGLPADEATMELGLMGPDYGFRQIRVVGESDVITMEYVADRVNVTIDNTGRVLNIRCF